MPSYQIQSILQDPSLVAEIKRNLLPAPAAGAFESLDAEEETDAAPGGPLEPFMLAGGAGSAAGIDVDAGAVARHASRDRGFEAIVERFGRPSLLVRNGTFELPASDTWKGRLYPTKSRIDKAIRSVGRLELMRHSMSWVGTAWMIAEGIVVTNRHVALTFSQKTDEGFSFRHNPTGLSYGARVDFKEEHLQLAALEVEVERILYVAENDDRHPDLAFLKLKSTNGKSLPPPIPINDARPATGQTVAVIGYPAYDDRNNAEDMARIFGDTYGVKRLAPGEVRETFDDGSFAHDSTTLGGNSGSCVIDVVTGTVLGLHFAGEYLRSNYAVGAETLRRYLSRLTGTMPPTVTVKPSPAEPSGDEAPQPSIESLSDRAGYDSRFLGEGEELEVPLPLLSAAMEKKAAEVSGATSDEEKYLLNYTNYSVVMNKERRMAFYTATNIDGEQWKSVKRKKDAWFYDPRIDRAAQVGEELYRDNDLDRGHLTRRLDPAWGAQYLQGEQDTFFFTNCTPQHHEFNTKTWLGLEDYLLSSADTRDFKACIFTGPIFGAKDHPYTFPLKKGETDNILIPLQYWKVAVMVRAETGALSATAYIISQADLISNLEFVFGQFKTYQVTVAKIKKLTGLDFGALQSYDPLGHVEGIAERELTAMSDIVI